MWLQSTAMNTMAAPSSGHQQYQFTMVHPPESEKCEMTSYWQVSTTRLMPNDGRALRIISETTNRTILDSLNRFINYREWNKEPFPRLNLRAEAIFQFQIQPGAFEESVQK